MTPQYRYFCEHQFELVERLEAVAAHLEAVSQRLEREPERQRKSLLTIDEVASELCCSTRHVRRLIALGRIRSARTTLSGSSRVLVQRSELDRFLQVILQP